jgi:hypothetical protein
MVHQRQAREQASTWFQRWLEQPGNAELLENTREHILNRGAVRTADFEYDGPRRGSWWDWKPVKIALEHLVTYGDLMIAGRHNFQRIYDLTERVLPDWVDCTEPSVDERNQHWVESAVKSLGICTPDQAGDYTFRKRRESRPITEQLLKDGRIVQVNAMLADGEIHELIVPREHLPLLEQAADGALPAERTTFLSPFDSLWWAKRRDELFWGFHQSIEAYLPQEKRQYGYFCLPILHKERLVGRFDPKLERRQKLLRLKALYLEPGIAPDEELALGIAQAMRSFMDFHNATELVIERSQPEEFGARLRQVLG